MKQLCWQAEIRVDIDDADEDEYLNDVVSYLANYVIYEWPSIFGSS